MSNDSAERRDGAQDFDFLFGRWRVHNERLAARLQGSQEWGHFEATLSVRPVLGGLGNMDEFETELGGARFLGMSLRLYDPSTRLWSIYWADNQNGVLQPPVVGAFEDEVGVFQGSDDCDGKPVIARFRWSEMSASSARWEQAFSPNEGASWETNWVMRFERLS